MISELAQASELLLEILTNTLDITKLEEKKIEFNKKYESINEVINMALDISKANARKRKVFLEAKYCPGIPNLVEIDKARITQVMLNLIDRKSVV